MTATTKPLGDVNLEGTFAGMPAAGIEGRLYFATDSDELYRDNGTSWDLVAAGGGGPPGTLALDEISDVNATTPADGDALVWDDGASEWVPGAVAGGGALDDLSDVNAPSPTDGQALVWDATPGEWIPGTIAAGGSATAFIGCRITRTTDQTAPTVDTATAIIFNATDIFDSDGFHDPSTNPSRVTIPAGFGGKYLVSYSVTWQMTPSGNYRSAIIRKNGTTAVGGFQRLGVSASGFLANATADVVELAAGDYIELVVQSNGSEAIAGSIVPAWMSVAKLESGRLGSAIGVKAIHSTTQSVSAVAALALDTDEFDTNGFHDTVTNNSRVTIPAGMGGKYLLIARTHVPASTTTNPQFVIWIRKNGSTVVSGSAAGNSIIGTQDLDSTEMLATTVADLIAGDYLEIMGFSVESLAFGHANDELATTFTAMRLDSGSSGSGGALAVEESDGSPAHSAVTKLIFPPDTVSLNGAFATIRQVPQAFIGARVYNSTTQSIPASANTSFTYDSERYDTDAIHSTVSTTDRLTCPAGMGGKWLVGLYVSYPTGTGVRFTYLTPSTGIDIAYDARPAVSGDVTRVNLSSVVTLAPGDYVYGQSHQSHSGALLVTAEMWMVKLDSGKVGAGIGCRLTMSAAQSIASGGSGTAVLWDTEDFDTDGFHSTSTNTSRVTIPAGLGGKYLLNAGGLTTAVATNGPEIWFKKNGTTDIVGTSRTAAYHSMGGLMGTSTVVDLAAGDYVEALFYQSTGSNKNFGYVAASAAAASFQVMRLDSGSSSGGSSVIALNDLTDVATTSPADGDVLAYDSGSSGWVNTAASGGGSGTAFPGSPVADQRFTRTDLDMDFFWNGTRWLSTAVYQHNFGTGYSNITATDANGVVARTQAPMLRGGSDIWLEDYKAVFYISGGSSLSASHKWVVTLRTLSTAASYAVATVTISSGARGAWRTTSGVIDALMDNGVAKLLTLTQATKTGTPGGLYFYSAITYRIVG